MAVYSTNEFKAGLKVILNNEPHVIVENEFVKPGKGIVRAEFEVHDVQIKDILDAAADGSKVLRDFSVEVKDKSGDVVARVVKTLYIRKKIKKSKSQHS